VVKIGNSHYLLHTLVNNSGNPAYPYSVISVVLLDQGVQRYLEEGNKFPFTATYHSGENHDVPVQFEKPSQTGQVTATVRTRAGKIAFRVELKEARTAQLAETQ